MTPEQKRQAMPLRPTTPAEQAINAANLIWSLWPFSAAHAASTEYCHTINAALDPHPCGVPLVDANR